MDTKLLTRMNFSVEPVTEIQEINPIISKTRVRIFYTGLNRNLTYITEEFAEKLLKTLPYTPVGGIWESDIEDFTDHGGPGAAAREKFQTFGVVPENPNVTWEEHLDNDGVMRRYACCDVYLWTARYKAAREIPKKAQSMELYIDSIKGQWKRSGAVEYYEFTDGHFFGLLALGDDVEPCFEGAAFYGFDSSAKEFFEELKNYTLSATKEHIGGTEMEKDLEQTVEETPVVEDNEVETPTEEPVEAPVVEEPTKEPTEEPTTESTEESVEEPTEEPTEESTEESATEEPVEEPTTDESTEEPVEETVEELVEEPAQDYEALNTRISELESQVSEYETQIASYQSQIAELTAYRDEAETEKKKELVNKYSSLLGEEICSEYTAKLGEYSYKELKSEISMRVLDENEETLFSKDETKEVVSDLDVTKNYSGAARLMSKYFKK